MKAESSQQRVKELFNEAVEKPADQRDSFLQAACGDDTDLREHVERLLAALEGDPDFLESPPPTTTDLGPDTTELLSNGEADLVGEQVSRYHLQRVIARGGMGAVYEAVQQKPHRTVAVKVMRRGIASKSALRRFEYESQILARLRHPGIAQVYEAGTWGAEGGVPYFVMEYVPNALPITEYVRQKKLSPTRRLELFSVVCEAVHHGHQRGIIHRDLKPANILIDSGGNPKIIDFGVARATDSDMAVTTLQTEVGQLIGTLQYMSPEQCRADPHDLDTRSDVYALGIVLYELLCEQLPYDVTHTSVPEAIRVVREESPSRPSTFNKTLRGDLETILLKSLEKERERRYQSAAELAGDITRYLNDEPITARPPSVGYQLRMFARRNKTAFGAMAAIFVVLVGAAAVSLAFAIREASARQSETRQRQLAEERRAAAETVTELLQGMLRSADPHGVMGRDYTVRQLLDDFATGMGHEVGEQADIEATLRTTIGSAYLNLGEYEKAEEHLKAALDIRTQLFGEEHQLVAESLANYAWLLFSQGDHFAPAPLLEQALAMQRRLLGQEHVEVATTLDKLAALKNSQGARAEGEALAIEALTMQRKLLGEEHPDTLSSMHTLAHAYDDPDRREPLYLEAAKIARRALGAEHPDTLQYLMHVAWTYRDQSRYDEAEPLFLEVMATQRRVLGEEHPHRSGAIAGLAWLYMDQRRYDEAEPLFREALEINRRMRGAGDGQTMSAMSDLGRCYAAQGRYDEAEPLLLEALEVTRRVRGAEHRATLEAAGKLARLYEIQSRYNEAEALLRDALTVRRSELPKAHPDIARSLALLGLNLVKQERYAEAESVLRECLEIRQQALPKGYWVVPDTVSILGGALAGQDRYVEAEPLLVDAYESLRDNPAANEVRTREALERLVDLYEAWDRPEKAAEYRVLLQEAEEPGASG